MRCDIVRSAKKVSKTKRHYAGRVDDERFIMHVRPRDAYQATTYGFEHFRRRDDTPKVRHNVDIDRNNGVPFRGASYVIDVHLRQAELCIFVNECVSKAKSTVF